MALITELILLRAAESLPHSTLGICLSTATDAPRLPTLLDAPATMVVLSSSQYT